MNQMRSPHWTLRRVYRSSYSVSLRIQPFPGRYFDSLCSSNACTRSSSVRTQLIEPQVSVPEGRSLLECQARRDQCLFLCPGESQFLLRDGTWAHGHHPFLVWTQAHHLSPHIGNGVPYISGLSQPFSQPWTFSKSAQFRKNQMILLVQYANFSVCK